MPARSSSRVPAYRITLFYGPETTAASPPTVECVFNVKKRSWKGGVHVAVELDRTFLDRVERALSFDAWCAQLLHNVPERADETGEHRVRDLLVQQVAYRKLYVAIQRGLSQEHGVVSAHELVEESFAAVVAEADDIKAQVAEELDIDEMGTEAAV